MYLVLFGIAALGVLALLLIIWGRVKKNPKTLLSPELGDISAIQNEHNIQHNIPDVASFVLEQDQIIQKVDNPALASLGFSAYDGFFTDTKSASPEPAADEVQIEKSYSYVPKQKSFATEDFIVLYLVALPGKSFVGYELLQALLLTGLRFGEMNIFHRYLQEDIPASILFSVASAVEPGIFDLTNIGAFSSPGLSLFMAIRGNHDPVASFELMLETGIQLAEELGGTLCDENRLPLTNVVIESYRTKINAKYST